MKTIETIQQEFHRGMTHIPAEMVGLPLCVLRQEVATSLRPGQPFARSGEAAALFLEDTPRFDRVGNILFDSVVEPLNLAQRTPGEIKSGLVLSYGKGATLTDHDDRYLLGQYVRLAYFLSGEATFHSTVTGEVDVFAGDVLVQNLAKGIRHGVKKVKTDRMVALWDIPTLPIFST